MLKALIRIYREAYRGLPKTAWMLAAAAFVNSSGTMVIFFLSLYLTQKLHFSTSFAGQALSLYGLGGIAGAYLGGRLCDKVGATRVQGMSLLLTGGLCISPSFFQSRPAALSPGGLSFSAPAFRCCLWAEASALPRYAWPS